VQIRQDFLPVLRPLGGDEEKKALADVIDSGWWGKGERVKRFEQRFAELVGAKHAIAVTSATHGQDLVLKALGIRGGDVISPTISFMTTGVVPLWNDCQSLLADVERESLNISAKDVAELVSDRTKAIIAVNHAGIPADIPALRSVFDGFILEDCAHSCYVDGAGRRGDVAVWSFQAVKTLPTGDGGMITLDDTELYEKLVPMTWLGISSTFSRVRPTLEGSPEGRPGYSWDYQVEDIGYKCYMTDLTAAIGLVQLDKLPGHLERRRQIQAYYNEELPREIQRPLPSETVQYYCARVDAHVRDPLIDYLASKRIHTSVHFKPLHKYAVLRQDRPLPVADEEWVRLISLPCHPGMTDEDVDYVVYWVRRFFDESSSGAI
jgi:perosamine synthetase